MTTSTNLKGNHVHRKYLLATHIVFAAKKLASEQRPSGRDKIFRHEIRLLYSMELLWHTGNVKSGLAVHLIHKEKVKLTIALSALDSEIPRVVKLNA